jgi:4-alpha-glucanotransferase
VGISRIKYTSGVLLHPTSFPSSYGIGDLGSSAYEFIEWLHQTGFTLWQVLPLAPPAENLCPYFSHSSVGGNPLLISPDKLVTMGLLEESDLPSKEITGMVDVEIATKIKSPLFKKAFRSFLQDSQKYEKEFSSFLETEKSWVRDYSLFHFFHQKEEKIWTNWGEECRNFSKIDSGKLLTSLIPLEVENIQYHQFLQWIFHKQYSELREYAHSKGVSIIGDIPQFSPLNSLECWKNPEYFELDQNGKPIHLTGVPPDDFSEEGQLWKHPQYNWEKIKEDDFLMWLEKFDYFARHFDFIRLDHFIALERAWYIDGENLDPKNGVWKKTLGRELLQAVTTKMPDLQIIAEDLGVMDEAVEKLRDDFKLPGMHITQCELLSKDYDSMKSKIITNSVTYTGTHDNDTAKGMIEALPEEKCAEILSKLNIKSKKEFPVALIRESLESPSQTVIIPLQDILELDSSSRFNNPGTTNETNWTWRYNSKDLNANASKKMRALIDEANRLPC